MTKIVAVYAKGYFKAANIKTTNGKASYSHSESTKFQFDNLFTSRSQIEAVK